MNYRNFAKFIIIYSILYYFIFVLLSENAVIEISNILFELGTYINIERTLIIIYIIIFTVYLIYGLWTNKFYNYSIYSEENIKLLGKTFLYFMFLEVFILVMYVGISENSIITEKITITLGIIILLWRVTEYLKSHDIRESLLIKNILVILPIIFSIVALVVSILTFIYK
ncbi:hypothetical protein [Companilactobacillus metriopterae]|uniref:hypothetical protein n=1 Tax=Companilactobacillus metriopterae TaxID=1909267 RepID=UPI00100AED6D|nr:hypothetical protein [Companilactobacillus metriopterae]